MMECGHREIRNPHTAMDFFRIAAILTRTNFSPFSNPIGPGPAEFNSQQPIDVTNKFLIWINGKTGEKLKPEINNFKQINSIDVFVDLVRDDLGVG